MSKCDVWFEFDQAERVYRPGETLSGLVHVRVNDDCPCNKIFLRMQWRTHGKGNQAEGGEQEFAFVEQTQLRAGEDHTFPFRFSAPSHPITYRGEALNVDWYLTAAVDIPWAIDPKAEEEFVVYLEPAPEAGLPALPDAETELPPSRKSSRKWLWIAMIGSIAGLEVFLFFMFMGRKQGVSAFLPLFLLPGLLIVGGALFYFWSTRKAREKVGPLDFEIEEINLRRGEVVPCTVRFAPPDPALIEGVRCTLRARERVVSGSGTSKSTTVREVYTRPLRYPGPFLSDPGETLELPFAFLIPGDAPLSFKADDNALNWDVELHVELAKWVDHREAKGLHVTAT